MAFKKVDKCKICQKIYEEAGNDAEKVRTSRLFQLINKYHLKGTTIQAISDEYEMRYLGVRNHALKHQNPSAKALAKTAKKEIVTRKRQEELRVLKGHKEVRQDLITQLEVAFQNGDLKANLGNLVALLKQEADIEEKQKDRQFEMAKMIAKYQSGELKADDTRRITSSTD